MDGKEKQEKIEFLTKQIAEVNALIDALNAEVDALVESDPEKLLSIWESRPQEAIEIAERLGWDWFLNTHTI